MKASDLRIGNYYNQYGTVQTVNWNTLKQLGEASKDQLWCKPIPLTPDELEKFGFTELDDYFHSPRFGNDEWIELSFDGDHLTVLYRQENVDGEIETILQYIEITYLHELQNWWKTNTGEELTYTT